jgi:hypothetical protein
MNVTGAMSARSDIQINHNTCTLCNEYFCKPTIVFNNTEKFLLCPKNVMHATYRYVKIKVNKYCTVH